MDQTNRRKREKSFSRKLFLFWSSKNVFLQLKEEKLNEALLEAETNKKSGSTTTIIGSRLNPAYENLVEAVRFVETKIFLSFVEFFRFLAKKLFLNTMEKFVEPPKKKKNSVKESKITRRSKAKIRPKIFRRKTFTRRTSNRRRQNSKFLFNRRATKTNQRWTSNKIRRNSRLQLKQRKISFETTSIKKQRNPNFGRPSELFPAEFCNRPFKIISSIVLQKIKMKVILTEIKSSSEPEKFRIDFLRWVSFVEVKRIFPSFGFSFHEFIDVFVSLNYFVAGSYDDTRRFKAKRCSRYSFVLVP